MPCPENTVISGVVTGFLATPEGEIAFVDVPEYGPVTISLNHTCWRGQSSPKKRERVVIEGVTMFDKGWRGCQARQYTIDDQKAGR